MPRYAADWRITGKPFPKEVVLGGVRILMVSPAIGEYLLWDGARWSTLAEINASKRPLGDFPLLDLEAVWLAGVTLDDQALDSGGLRPWES